MNVHRFAIGQSVRLKGTIGMALQTGDMFRITGRMPARDWSPQYRISNDEGRHERVAEERNLEEAPVGNTSVFGLPSHGEKRVLELLVLGRPTEEMAAELAISPDAVRGHVQNILTKLGVHSRLEAVARWKRPDSPRDSA